MLDLTFPLPRFRPDTSLLSFWKDPSFQRRETWDWYRTVQTPSILLFFEQLWCWLVFCDSIGDELGVIPTFSEGIWNPKTNLWANYACKHRRNPKIVGEEMADKCQYLFDEYMSNPLMAKTYAFSERTPLRHCISSWCLLINFSRRRKTGVWFSIRFLGSTFYFCFRYYHFSHISNVCLRIYCGASSFCVYHRHRYQRRRIHRSVDDGVHLVSCVFYVVVDESPHRRCCY